MAKNLTDLARIVAEIQAAQKTSRNGPQLAYSSIEDGAIDENDAFGNNVAVFGKQYDGTHTSVSLRGPKPTKTTPPELTSGPGVMTVRWNGKFFEDRSSPMDYKHTAVCVTNQGVFPPDQLDQKATIRGEMGDEVVLQLPPGTYYVALFAWTESGKSSDSSEIVSVKVPMPADISEIEDRLDDISDAANSAQTAAGEANIAAGEAETKASDAQLAADQAVQDALDASNAASAASDKAGTAESTASGAVTAAVEAANKAQQALDDALSAGNNATQAKDAAALATTAAQEAQAAAESSGTAADLAASKAAGAASVAAQAVADALEAQNRADEAFTKASSAMTKAGEAQNSANGKNNVYYRDTLPSGSGFVEGDTTFIRSSVGQPITAQFQWDGSDWKSSEFGHQIISSVDLGKATVGELDGVFIKSKTIHVESLLIGDFTNLIREPNFAMGGSEWESSDNFDIDPNGGRYDGPAGRLKGNGEYQAIVQKSPGTPCEEGDAFRISAWYKPSVDLSWLYMSFYARFELAGGDFELDLAWAKTVYAGEWGETYGIVTAPEGTVSVSFGFGVKANVDPGEEILFDQVSARRATTGKLIVDGALDARTITAPKIQSVVAPNRGLKWIEEGLVAYNGTGTQTFNLSATTGEASFLGKVRSGSEIEGALITGGAFQTSVGPGGIKIDNDQLEVNDESGDGGITLAPSSDSSGWDTSKAVMKFRTGSPSENRAGAFYSFSDGDTDQDRLSLQAWSPERNSHGMASLQLFSGTVLDAASVFLGGEAADGAATLKLSGDGYAYLSAPDDLNLVAPNLNMHGNLRSHGGKIVYEGTTPNYDVNFLQSDYPIHITPVNSGNTSNGQLQVGFLDVDYINGYRSPKFVRGGNHKAGGLTKGSTYSLNITYASLGFTENPAVLVALNTVRANAEVTSITKTSASIRIWNGTDRDTNNVYIIWDLVGH